LMDTVVEDVHWTLGELFHIWNPSFEATSHLSS
jgi:hypothetical protein